MSKFSNNISKKEKRLSGLALFLLLVGVVWFYFYATTFYVIVRFDELGALAKNMPAYYNGFKIGKIVSIEPDVDFKHTIVRVNLDNKNINLPQNTTAKVESFPNGELYLQLVYPKSPSLRTMQRGDLLEGIAPYSPEQFMLGQNISGVTDVVSIYVIRALKATEIANMEMTNFFKNSSKLINENSEGIIEIVNNTVFITETLGQMSENLNQTTKNLNQTSKKINGSIDEKTLKDTTLNVKATTENISKATKDLDKTVKKVDDTISELNATAKNLNSITSGLNQTLGQRFGGMRVMFGKPVKSKHYVRNCCE